RSGLWLPGRPRAGEQSGARSALLRRVVHARARPDRRLAELQQARDRCAARQAIRRWPQVELPGPGRKARQALQALATALRLHQIFTRLPGSTYSFSPGLTPNAVYQASRLRTTPLTRNWRGECGSLTTCLRTKSSVTLPRQACAQPSITRWSPVNPSITGAGLPCSEA